MEDGPVIEALLHQGKEIVHRVGRDLRIKLRLDDPSVFHFDGHNWIFHKNIPFCRFCSKKMMVPLFFLSGF